MKCLEAKGKSAKASGMLTEQSAAVKEVRRKIGQEATIKRLERELVETRRQLSEALKQQAATSEVLKVIAKSPGQLEPVFMSMLENASRICEASFGSMMLLDGDAFPVRC
jgi:hypothetical protein